MPAVPGRAPRRDAQRNRALLIETAARAFKRDGLEVGVDELARRAGVGVATLYRHFPTKGALVLAVADELLDELARRRDAILAEGPPGGELARFLRAALAHLRANRGFVEALQRHPPDPEIRRRMRRRLLRLLEPLAQRARETGELAAGYDAEDLRIALRMVGAASKPDGARDPERYLALVLRGLGEPPPRLP